MTIDKLQLAKERYSRAAAAYLRGDAGAVERCQRALTELEAARGSRPTITQRQKAGGARR